MQTLKWSDKLKGSFFLNLEKLERPCIYAWYRKTKCLYIGQSKKGILRVLGRHHVIGTQERIEAEDEIRLFFPELRAEDSLDFWEVRLIKQLRPFYNITHNNEKTITPKGVYKLSEHLSTKEKLADVLQQHMQTRTLLADTHSNPNAFTASVSNATDDELEEYIRSCRQTERAIKQLNPKEFNKIILNT